ncbi:MAG TPA: beta-hexosaminidase, partial [Allosphingosinicella sp.]
GFDGFLMSDDIGMNALGGGFDERARGVIEAGTDAVLHCSGKMDEMVAVASAVGALGGKGRERLERAMAGISGAPSEADYAELADKRDRLLALA